MVRMMREIARVLDAERLKLVKRKSSWILPAVTGVLALLVFLAVGYAAQRDWVGVTSGFFVASSSAGWMVNFIGLLAVIVTCFNISGEFAGGTVKPCWVMGISRSGWYYGKIISATVSTAALFAVVIVVLTIGAAVTYGFTDLKEKDFLVHTAGSMGWGFVLSTVLTLLALWAVVTVTSMVAVLLNRPGASISVCIISAVVLSIVAVFEPARPFLITSCISLPLEQMTAMSKGLPLPLEWTTLAWRTVVCAVCWSAAACTIGRLIIIRKEVTF
jgi:hypothetical protein